MKKIGQYRLGCGVKNYEKPLINLSPYTDQRSLLRKTISILFQAYTFKRTKVREHKLKTFNKKYIQLSEYIATTEKPSSEISSKFDYIII